MRRGGITVQSRKDWSRILSYYFELALFIGGYPNPGKSNQLRGMFRDVRLGTGGDIPWEQLPEPYASPMSDVYTCTRGSEKRTLLRHGTATPNVILSCRHNLQ
jgi:hypothetical protein